MKLKSGCAKPLLGEMGYGGGGCTCQARAPGRSWLCAPPERVSRRCATWRSKKVSNGHSWYKRNQEIPESGSRKGVNNYRKCSSSVTTSRFPGTNSRNGSKPCTYSKIDFNFPDIRGSSPIYIYDAHTYTYTYIYIYIYIYISIYVYI